jgi:hypothetical protein
MCDSFEETKEHLVNFYLRTGDVKRLAIVTYNEKERNLQDRVC